MPDELVPESLYRRSIRARQVSPAFFERIPEKHSWIGLRYGILPKKFCKFNKNMAFDSTPVFHS